MPGCSGVTVVTTLGCLFLSAPRLRRIVRPAFPAPSDFREREIQVNLARKAAARTRTYVSRHCEEQSDEAIHTYFAATWIASLALAMTVTMKIESEILCESDCSR